MDNRLAAIFSLDLFSDSTAVSQILSLNEKSEQHGLTLTPSDAAALVQTRTEALSANGRVEVGSATIGKLVDAFCESSYINQREYPAIMHALIEIFYEAKNETLNLISDDELIDFMKNSFEYSCGGSLDLLAGRELNKLAENLRFGIRDYTNMDPDAENPDADDWDENWDKDEWDDEKQDEWEAQYEQ